MNLPKVTWRKYLKEAKRRGSDIDRIRRYKIRERAKRLMEDLTLAICGIEKLSKHPEKDFAKHPPGPSPGHARSLRSLKVEC